MQFQITLLQMTTQLFPGDLRTLILLVGGCAACGLATWLLLDGARTRTIIFAFLLAAVFTLVVAFMPFYLTE